MDKRRGRPVPDAIFITKPLAFNLEEALQVENEFRSNSSIIISQQQADLKPDEVTPQSRDAAVNVLRFLRIWLDLPHKVYFYSVSYLDMFLAKMRVQEKFLKCLTLSCLYVAIEICCELKKIDVNKLVKVSQSKCTAKDVARMANIVKEKLKISKDDEALKITTTPCDFLKIYIDILKCVTKKWEHIIDADLNCVHERMKILLEVLLTDSNTAHIRPSVLALLVFQGEVEKILSKGLPEKSLFYLGEVLQFLSIIRELQLKCFIKNAELKHYYLQVTKVLMNYECENKKKNAPKVTLTNQLNFRRHYPFFETIQE